jgi:hypothetical protein
MNVHFTELAEVVTYLHKTAMERVSLDDIDHVLENAEKLTIKKKSRPPNAKTNSSDVIDSSTTDEDDMREKKEEGPVPTTNSTTTTATNPNTLSPMFASSSSSSSSGPVAGGRQIVNCVLRVIAETKRLTRWMRRCLQENARQRLLVLAYFIDFARHLKSLNNYNGLWAFHRFVTKSRVQQDLESQLEKKADRDFLSWTQDLFRRDENNQYLYPAYSAQLVSITEPKVCCFQIEVALLRASVGEDVRASTMSHSTSSAFGVGGNGATTTTTTTATPIPTRLFSEQKRLDTGKLRRIMHVVGNLVDVRFARYVVHQEDPFDVHIRSTSSPPSPNFSPNVSPTNSSVGFNSNNSPPPMHVHSGQLLGHDLSPHAKPSPNIFIPSVGAEATSPSITVSLSPTSNTKHDVVSGVRKHRSSSNTNRNATIGSRDALASPVTHTSSSSSNSYTNSSYSAGSYMRSLSSSLQGELESEMAALLLNGYSVPQREIVFAQFSHLDDIRQWIENEATPRNGARQ